MYASNRDWSCLYGAIRSEPERALSVPALTSECLWEVGTLTLSLFSMHRSGCSYCDASGEWVCLPSLRLESESSALLLRVSIKKKRKKVSVAARQSVHPSERSPTLPSSSGLCIRQIENEQQSTVGEVSQSLKVMALASRLAGPDNAGPSLPGSDSWLS